MLDSEYFRKGLQSDVDAIGGESIVEVHFVNGRSQRLRSVILIQQGYVVLEGYTHLDVETAEAGWHEPDREGRPPHETERIVIAYEAIASVRITGARVGGAPKVGFGRRTNDRV